MRKTTEYKNISWSQKRRRWVAAITHKKVRYECGMFENEIDAVKAVDRRIIALWLPKSKLQIFKPIKSEDSNSKPD